MVSNSPHSNNIKSWKQVGLDLGRPPTNTNSQVRNWQALQTPANAKDVTSLKITSKPSKTGLTQDVKLATTPKKRIVSDDHWKKDRTPVDSPQSVPHSAQKAISPDKVHGFAKIDGSPTYNAWVRKVEKSPSKEMKEEKKKESQQEESDPLDLLYWMTGKPKPPSPVRRSENTRPVVEESEVVKRRVQEQATQQMSPPRTPKPEPKKPILPALATAAKKDLTPQRPSPIPATINNDKLKARSHANRIDAWLERSNNSNRLESTSSEEDYSSPSMYSERFRLPPRRDTRVPSEGRYGLSRYQDRSPRVHNDEHAQFSSPRTPRHRYDEADHMGGQPSSPSSPNSLRRRGAKRQSRSPRKVSVPQRSEYSYADNHTAESIVTSEEYDETIYSTTENERHDSVKFIKRQSPALVDIPPRRVSNQTVFTASPSKTADDDAFFDKSEKPSHIKTRPLTKCRTTTDADLMSVLSVPELEQRGLPQARATLQPVDVKEILEDLRIDDEQYLQELRTLTNDVIPVLLSTALSKANSKDMVGVLGSTSTASTATDAIVSIGVVLERLKGCHQRMPTTNVTSLLCWAENAHQVYADYLKVWRLGFQEMVVNLPSKTAVAEDAHGLSNAASTTTPGQTNVNVAFLLKRPLIRVKYLARSLKHISQAQNSTLAVNCVTKFHDLVELAKRRQNEEKARLEDEAAASIDASRAKDLHTLTATVGVKIDRDRSVRARDCFQLRLHHSSGEQIDCDAELVLRDDKEMTDYGDVLICEVGPGSRHLLFPPVQLSKISARLGADLEELVVMVRGVKSDGAEWYELLTLRSEEEHVIREWHVMLGNFPLPPDSRALASSTIQSGTRANGMKGHRAIDRDKGDTRLFGVSEPGRGTANAAHTSPRSASGRGPPSVIYDQVLDSPFRNGSNTIGSLESSGSLTTNKSTPIIKRKAVPGRSDISATTSTTTTPLRGLPNDSARSSPVSPASPTQVIASDRANRRSSSPLKNEYRPDNSSATVSDLNEEYSDDDRSISSESSCDQYPMSPLANRKPLHSRGPRTLRRASAIDSISPSDSASQVLCDKSAKTAPSSEHRYASLLYWSSKGRWDVISPNECRIVVTPGLIEAYGITTTSTEVHDSKAPVDLSPRPIISLELTPLVPIRQGTALDISIRSPPTNGSTFQLGSNILFRSRNAQECATLFALINQSRNNNPTYIAMQNARGKPAAGSSNWAEYMDRRPDARNISSWWRFGSSKKSSYRKKTERTSSLAQTDGSGGGISSAFKRFGSIRAKSTSKSRSTEHSDSSDGVAPANLDAGMGARTGISNKHIRLYLRESAARWRDLGSAYLTILHPAQPAVITPTGHLLQEKRVVVISKHGGHALLDVTLGETSFERVARTGIAVSVIEELRGNDGVPVAVGDKGGVGGNKVKVFMMQMKSEAEAAYTFSLVGRLRY